MSNITLIVVSVLFDMDGTLVKFIDGGDIFKAKYFEELPPQVSICEAAADIDGKTVFVEIDGKRYLFVLRTASLSSYLTNTPHDVLTEKNHSLDMHTNISQEDRYFTPCGSSKWEYAVRHGIAKHGVMVDDYGRNLADWQGPQIKVSRDSEDMKKEMQRFKYCISPDQTRDEIAETILRVVQEQAISFIA